MFYKGMQLQSVNRRSAGGSWPQQTGPRAFLPTADVQSHYQKQLLLVCATVCLLHVLICELLHQQLLAVAGPDSSAVAFHQDVFPVW